MIPLSVNVPDCTSNKEHDKERPLNTNANEENATLAFVTVNIPLAEDTVFTDFRASVHPCAVMSIEMFPLSVVDAVSAECDAEPVM